MGKLSFSKVKANPHLKPALYCLALKCAFTYINLHVDYLS